MSLFNLTQRLGEATQHDRDHLQALLAYGSDERAEILFFMCADLRDRLIATEERLRALEARLAVFPLASETST